VTASQAGTVDNGLTVTLSSASNQPKYFTSASFTGTSGTLSGGEAGTTTPATIYSYIIAGSNQTSGFDTNGNLLSYNDLITGGWTMTYDNVNRLSTGVASSGVWNSLTLGWMYDSFGNRKTQTPGGNPNAPVPPAQTLTYLPGHNKISNWGSDQAGNITSDGIHQYAYDSEGRVCAVSYFNTGESAFMAYVYDAEGRRVAKGSTNGLNCNMAANDFTLMEQSILGLSGESVSQLDGSGNFLRSNVYANGQLLATYNNNSAYFSFGDWLGSKRVVANPTGTVAEMCMNLPFGDDLICSANDPSQHHFTGQLHDLETGNDYFNARYYGNSSGRFMSPDYSESGDDPDPVPYADYTNPQSLNLYAYVNNNPLSLTDPDGHGCFDNQGSVTSDTTDSNGTETVNVSGGCDLSDFLPTQVQVSQFVHQLQNTMEQVQSFITAPRDPACMSAAVNGGIAAGAASGAVGGLAGSITGPGEAVIEPTAILGGATIGGAAGFAGGLSACKTGGAGSGSPGSAGGGGGLSNKAKSKLGNLANRAGEKVRDVIRSRGGSGSNVNQAGPWADRTLGETAEAAAQGDSTAETAIKVAKQAGRLGQQY
jgi:RHS repeat-associated protein